MALLIWCSRRKPVGPFPMPLRGTHQGSLAFRPSPTDLVRVFGARLRNAQKPTHCVSAVRRARASLRQCFRRESAARRRTVLPAKPTQPLADELSRTVIRRPGLRRCRIASLSWAGQPQSRYASIRRSPLGSGIGSPNSLAVSIQKSVAWLMCRRAASCVSP